jgi:diguanylate cyclase (GGDEF)-like protein
LVIFLAVLVFALILYVSVRLILNRNEKDRLNYLFIHDQLTYSLNELGLKQEFLNKKSKNGFFILIDIYKFRLINEKYGMNTGDRILIRIAKTLSSINHTISGRVSGDEFIIIFHGNVDLKNIIVNLKEKLNELSIVFNISNLQFNFASVEYPKFGRDFDLLINATNNAMIISKQNLMTEDCINYTETIKEKFIREEKIRQELISAMENNELEMYYQPQVNIITNEIIGCEALIRWIHPQKGIILPSKFISIAERFGLINKLDQYVTHKVFEQVKKWQNENYKKIKVSFNMSTSTFENQDIVEFIRDLLNTYDVDTEWISLELTEETGVNNYELTYEKMEKIQSFGISFSLDDFGKGYSSLNYLEKLPANNHFTPHPLGCQF